MEWAWLRRFNACAVGFYCCHVTTFWNLIGTADFQAAEVTVWTRGSCQAVSSTAWEQGYLSTWCDFFHFLRLRSTVSDLSHVCIYTVAWGFLFMLSHILISCNCSMFCKCTLSGSPHNVLHSTSYHYHRVGRLYNYVVIVARTRNIR